MLTGSRGQAEPKNVPVRTVVLNLNFPVHYSTLKALFENIAPRRMWAAGQLKPQAEADLRHTFAGGRNLWQKGYIKIGAYRDDGHSYVDEVSTNDCILYLTGSNPGVRKDAIRIKKYLQQTPTSSIELSTIMTRREMYDYSKHRE